MTHEDSRKDFVDFTLASLVHSAIATEYTIEGQPYEDLLKDDTAMKLSVLLLCSPALVNASQLRSDPELS